MHIVLVWYPNQVRAAGPNSSAGLGAPTAARGGLWPLKPAVRGLGLQSGSAFRCGVRGIEFIVKCKEVSHLWRLSWYGGHDGDDTDDASANDVDYGNNGNDIMMANDDNQVACEPGVIPAEAAAGSESPPSGAQFCARSVRRASI
jgi:hypothetical protein